MLTPILVSLLLGSLIGLERQIHQRDAGIRTFALICLGSTLAMLLSESFIGDQGRIAAQVVSGISFLGAGIIIHSQDKVYGLTTAACTWISSIIGLTVGREMYFEACVTTGFVLVILFMFNQLK